MEYIFTKQEIKVLKHLADGQQHDEAPAELSDAQFYSALKSLKEKDMVYASFLTGGEVCSSQIKPEGRAALEQFKKKEKKILRTALDKFDLKHEQYELLINAGASSIEETHDNQKNIVFLDRIKGYLKKGFSYYGNRHWIITEEGQDVLDDIDDKLYDNSINVPLHVESSNERDYSVESVEQTEKAIGRHDIRIAEGHLAHVIEIVHAMCKLGYFEENGKEAPVKNVMETIGEVLHSEQLCSQYSAHLNRAVHGKKDTFFQPFYKLQEVAMDFYENRETRKMSRD